MLRVSKCHRLAAIAQQVSKYATVLKLGGEMTERLHLRRDATRTRYVPGIRYSTAHFGACSAAHGAANLLETFVSESEKQRYNWAPPCCATLLDPPLPACRTDPASPRSIYIPISPTPSTSSDLRL